MANNTNMLTTPLNENQLPKSMHTNGEQVRGSVPNLSVGQNQPIKQGLLNNNPNGYSPVPVSSPYAYFPAAQSPAINNLHNHHSSSHSSRNSSPAMNQSTPQMSLPYKQSVAPPTGNPLQPPLSRPLLQVAAPSTQIPSTRPTPAFAPPQTMFSANANKIAATPPLSQPSNSNFLPNNNQFASNQMTPPLVNRLANTSAPSSAPSHNLTTSPYPLHQATTILPPSTVTSSRMNLPPQSNNPTMSQPAFMPPQGNQLPAQQFVRPPPQNVLNPNTQHQTNRQGVPPLPPQPQPMGWSQPAQPVQNMSTPYYNNGQHDQLSHQMGKLNVTQNSFSQMWGHESVDLLQCRNVLTEDKEAPPTIKLAHHFSESVNCSPDIFRCTLTKIPESNNLLQKSRLPLGILIHPFKDLNHLAVIQCNSIVRCRSCRTYINPFVYFVDLKRWKCNLCYRVNDLPEEFQFDPVSKTYGEPRRRPEIQSATLEYIAPSEYMLRPPQPAAYCFVMDVSAEAARSGYLQQLCKTLIQHLKEIPGDSRTMLSFICFDNAVHFYSLRAGKPNQMTVMDIDDIFVPSPEDLLVNLAEKRSVIEELLEALPVMHANPCPSATQSALGSALTAANKLMASVGGRITVFQTCLPNIGPGALTAREDPNNRSSKDVAHLNPATDFYKRLALECSGMQVAVDLFLLNSQYADLSTLNGVSQFSGGGVYHFPLFKADKENQAEDFKRCLTRYLTRKIGFEAVMRVRCTRGISIHTFHGSFFVRSTDLLALPNISPDAGFGMQLSIDESLADVQQVCFQAALLYTSSKGERRIRVHTMCLPVVNSLNDVIHGADQQAIIGLLCKMGVDRALSSSLTDAREALLNAVMDALSTQKLQSGLSSSLVSPMALRLMPLYISALLKHPAFRIGTSTRLDDRIAAMCMMKNMPLSNLMRCVYPDLYPVHTLLQHTSAPSSEDETATPCPPRYHLSAEKVNANGAYLMDQETLMIIYIGHRIDLEWLQSTLGVSHPSLIPPEGWFSLPSLDTVENALLHTFINDLNNDKPYHSSVRIMIDTSPHRGLFIDKLLDDRVETALSYHEFLQHIKANIK